MSDDKFYRKVTGSTFYRIGDMLGDAIILSLLWLLFSLPVVTMLPSASALYYAVRRRVQGRSSSPAADFLKAFKDNLKNGIIIDLIYLVYTAIAVMNILIGYYGVGSVKMPDFYFPLSFILLLPIVLTVPFLIPCIARFENSVKGTLINSFIMSSMYLFKSLLIWVIFIVSSGISVIFPPALLLTPALCFRLYEHVAEQAIVYTIEYQNKKREANANGSLT